MLLAMNRPSFQFYPGDWRGNANLRRCSHAARGAWMDIMCVLHDSDEYGICRWPLHDLAQAAGVPIKLAEELRDKNVLKGSEKNMQEFTHTTRHAGQETGTHVLIPKSELPCWYSSRMVRDEWLKSRRGSATRFDQNRQPTRSPTGRQGGRQGDGPSSSSSSSLVEREQNFSETPPMSRKDYGAMAEMRGVPKDCSEWFWNVCDARNWTDSRGQPIRKVEPLLMNAWSKWRVDAPKGKNFSNGKPEKSLLLKIAESL